MALLGQEAAATSKEENYLLQDRFRPLLHFTPTANWMNDPNGLFLADDVYHLFYQHNPGANTWGDIVWGHARSNDLLHWEDLGTSLSAGKLMAFSGSAAECDTTLLGAHGGGVIVAAYTGHNPRDGLEGQHIALSMDRGGSWRQLSDGPVIDRRQAHFRDPRIFWHDESSKWVMAVALALEHKILFYGSRDLRNWEELGAFHEPEEPGVEWECPEILRFNDPANPEQAKWLLKVDVSSGAPSGGSGGKYFLGEFDGLRFEALPIVRNAEGQSAKWAWLDYGKDFYAAQSFSGIEKHEHPVWIGWVSNWQYARKTPTRNWRGCQSIPRKLLLDYSDGAYALRQQPIDNLASARGASISLAGRLEAGNAQPVCKPIESGLTFDLECQFQDWTAEEFGLIVAQGPDCGTRVGFRPGEQTVFIDRRISGEVGFSDRFPGIHEAPLGFGQTVDLRVIIDRSVVEVFVNGGKVVLTDLIFPGANASRMSIYAIGGGVTISTGRLWRLESLR